MNIECMVIDKPGVRVQLVQSLTLGQSERQQTPATKINYSSYLLND